MDIRYILLVFDKEKMKTKTCSITYSNCLSHILIMIIIILIGYCQAKKNIVIS